MQFLHQRYDIAAFSAAEAVPDLFLFGNGKGWRPLGVEGAWRFIGPVQLNAVHPARVNDIDTLFDLLKYAYHGRSSRGVISSKFS